MKIFYDQAYKLESDMSCANIFELHKNFGSNVYSEELTENGKISSITYNDYIEKCKSYHNKISYSLSECEKGRFVALKIPNSPKWGMVFWGLLMSGFCPFILDPMMSESEADALIKEIDACAVICETKGRYSVLTVSLNELSAIDAENTEVFWADNVAFCSSGTENKTICVFDGNALASQILAALNMPKYTDDIMYRNKRGKIKNLALLPFFHIFGFVHIKMTGIITVKYHITATVMIAKACCPATIAVNAFFIL